MLHLMTIVTTIVLCELAYVPKASCEADAECPSFQPPSTSSHLELFLPEPIGVRELEHYAKLLGMSDAQAQSMRIRHETYCADCTELKSTFVDPLWEQAARLVEGDRSAASRESLSNRRSQFVERLTTVEAAFFDQVVTTLSVGQQSLLPLVKADRTRQLFGPYVFTTCIHGEGTIDLVDLCRGLGIDEHENEKVQAILHEYRQTVAVRLRTMAKQKAAIGIKDSHLMEELQRVTRGDDPNQRADAPIVLEEQRRSLHRPRIVECKKLKSLNLKHLQRLEESLNDPNRTRLHNEFYRRAYPTIYNNFVPMEVGANWLLSGQGLSDDQRTAIQSLATQLKEKDLRMCREMEEHVSQYMERRRGGHSLHIDEIAEHDALLKSMKAKRSTYYQTAVKQFLDTLTPEQRESLSKTGQGDPGDLAAIRPIEPVDMDSDQE